MKLNEDIYEIVLDAMSLAQQEKWNYNDKHTRAIYDSFRIQNLVKKLNLHIVIKGEAEQLKCDCGETKDVRNIPICACCYNPHTGEW